MTPSAAELRFKPGGVEPPLLLNPGPLNVSQRVAEAMLQGDLCHREPEFSRLQDEVRHLLGELFAENAVDAVRRGHFEATTDKSFYGKHATGEVPGAIPEGGYVPLLLTGSGTCAVEAAVSSLVPPGGAACVLENGVYGERMAAMARAHGIEVIPIRREWTAPQDPSELAVTLDENPEITTVFGVHHETTTGLLNPVRELAAVCRERGKTFVLDAVSSLAGEELELDAWGIDACVATANKCIRGLPGLSFVIVRRDLLKEAGAWPPRSVYLNLASYYAKQDLQVPSGVPFTPAIQVAYALQEALLELREGRGVPGRIARYKAVAAHLRAGLTELGLKELLAPDVPRSNTITTLELPMGWTYLALHDALRERGFVIYAGQGPLAQQAFRISNMGLLDEADMDRLLAALRELLAKSQPA